jgi:uncharacterized membrane protein
MAGATSATYENTQEATSSGNSIDQLFAGLGQNRGAAPTQATPHVMEAGMQGVSLSVPKLSKTSLANADSWIWFGFASVIFFIVTAVAALYMLIVENNVRNLLLTRDYPQRRRHLTQLHMIELADGQHGYSQHGHG